MDGHFGGGSGTREAPYLVEDWADFASMNLMVWYALPAHLDGVNGSWRPPETAGAIDSIQYLWADGNKPKVICDRQFFPNWYVVPSDTAYPYRLRWFYYPESDYRTAVQQKHGTPQQTVPCRSATRCTRCMTMSSAAAVCKSHPMQCLKAC